jgi:hypothetical protein
LLVRIPLAGRCLWLVRSHEAMLAS